VLSLDNPEDKNFNQLLGIKNGRVIVGYFGDGAKVRNNGYVLVPANHYSVENFIFPNGKRADQTQAIGINNQLTPSIVGFYTEDKNVHGFWDFQGKMLTVDDPLGVFKGPARRSTSNQNLLSVNSSGEASGFWTDQTGNTHGFVVQNLGGVNQDFIEFGPDRFNGGKQTQVTGITERNGLCGFWIDSNGGTHGFTGFINNVVSVVSSFDVVIGGVLAKSTQPLGCNSGGFVVGTYTDSVNAVHGFIYNAGSRTAVKFAAPGESQKPAFGVQGTIINGINDNGDIVGFFSDGTRVNGFVDFQAQLP
jgi:hypothetical protein